MPVPTGFQRAQLEIEGGGTLACWFNPQEYSISKSNGWSDRDAVGSSLPRTQFTGGEPRHLSLDLLFHADPDGDVSSATDQLFHMMEVDASLNDGGPQGRPPTVRFSWGAFTSFEAVCSSLSVQFSLFRPDGTPIRARASLSLKQVVKDARSGSGTPPGQNPTTRSDRRLRSHVVRDGDSLQSIAHRHYRDPTRWRMIAEANGIDDPLRLPRGATLSIPVLEL